MRPSFIFTVSVVAVTLAACGGDDDAAPQTPVSRNFDELARAVAGCAETLRDCKDEDAGTKAAEACRAEFIQCRTDAGKSAQDSLVDEISECQDRKNDCAADASTDAKESRCAQSLRACIGEARSDSKNDSSHDAGGPNANPPTYQCFGQLRECISGGSAPQKCAADARACVIAAVGDPPVIRKPHVVTAVDAGTNAGAGGAAGSHAGSGGSAGKGVAGRGAAGSGGKAGAAGAAGAAGKAGKGGEPGDMDGDAQACMGEYEACLMSGEKEMTCAKEQRKCMKEES